MISIKKTDESDIEGLVIRGGFCMKRLVFQTQAKIWSLGITT